MKKLIIIIILSFNVYGQDIINNHYGANFQYDYIHKAGYDNPLYKIELEGTKRIENISGQINIGHFFRYIKTNYESKHYISIKAIGKYHFNKFYLGGGLEYTKAKVGDIQNVYRGIIAGGYKVDDLLEIVSEYTFPDNSLYKLSSIHFGFNYYYPIKNEWYLQIKEQPFLFFTNRDNLGRVGNDFAIGIVYSK